MYVCYSIYADFQWTIYKCLISHNINACAFWISTIYTLAICHGEITSNKKQHENLKYFDWEREKLNYRLNVDVRIFFKIVFSNNVSYVTLKKNRVKKQTNNALSSNKAKKKKRRNIENWNHRTFHCQLNILVGMVPEIAIEKKK